MLSEPKISYKPFWGICRPLNSWRANSPNPIQIYCAFNKATFVFKSSSFATLSWSTVFEVVTVSLFVLQVKRNSLIEGMRVDRIMC